MKHCHRCGKCCTWAEGNKIKRCKFLIGTIGGLTSCRVYANRLGLIVNKKPLMRCGRRDDYPVKIEGCTYL